MAVALASNVFVTKEEAREFVFTEADEAERTQEELDILYRIVNGICTAVETYCGARFIVRASIVETFDGGSQEVLLKYYPVTAVTSVIEDGVALVANTGYISYLNEGRICAISTDAQSRTFCSGFKKVVVTYSAGYGTQNVTDGEVISIVNVPEDVRIAALIWIRALWKKEPENFTSMIGNVYISPRALPSDCEGLLAPYVRITV
jgi:hypothetical protein